MSVHDRVARNKMPALLSDRRRMVKSIAKGRGTVRLPSLSDRVYMSSMMDLEVAVTKGFS